MDNSTRHVCAFVKHSSQASVIAMTTCFHKQRFKQTKAGTRSTFHNSTLQPPPQEGKGKPSDARTDAGNGRPRSVSPFAATFLDLGQETSHATCRRTHAQILYVCGLRSPRDPAGLLVRQSGCRLLRGGESGALRCSVDYQPAAPGDFSPGLCCFFVAPAGGTWRVEK